MATGLHHVVEQKAGKSCLWGEEPHGIPFCDLFSELAHVFSVEVV